MAITITGLLVACPFWLNLVHCTWNSRICQRSQGTVCIWRRSTKFERFSVSWISLMDSTPIISIPKLVDGDSVSLFINVLKRTALIQSNMLFHWIYPVSSCKCLSVWQCDRCWASDSPTFL